MSRLGARRTSYAASTVAVALIVAACATTPPPEVPDPEPEPIVVAPMSGVSGVVEGYAAGAASFGAHLYDFDLGEFVAGTSGGAIDAAGAFSFEFLLPPSQVLTTVSPDEATEAYGACFSLSRTIRSGIAEVVAYTGDLPNPTVLEWVTLFDDAAPDASQLLYFVRPVGGDTVDLTIHLPLTTMTVVDSVTSEATTTFECGSREVTYRLAEGWTLWSTRAVSSTWTLPSGDDLHVDVILDLEIANELPESMRLLIP